MPRSVRCCRCGALHEAHRWTDLDLVDELSGETVLACVTEWPVDLRIQVRRCTCGQPMARTSAPRATR